MPDETINEREAILGAATALEGQWAGSWIDALRKAAERLEPREPVAAGIDREEFLTRFPQMEGAIPQMEARWGRFLRSGSCNLEDGRFIMVTRFKRIYSIAFHNPQNKEEEKTFEVNLSPEALRALCVLAQLFEQPGDMEALETALGMKV